MTVDQRLFEYPLESELQRLRWQLDRELAELAMAVSNVETLRVRRDSLASESLEVARLLSRAQARRLDPMQTRQTLEYMAAMQRQQAQAVRDLEDAVREVASHRDRIAATQAEIDTVESDRCACLADHLRDRQRHELRETDQDWTARCAWRARIALNEEASR